MTNRRTSTSWREPEDDLAVARVGLPPSLSEHVCQVLRDDILAGRLAPGERLTEALAIERTGASRTPVREGLRRLEAEGLVISHRSRGTYVTYRLSSEEASLIYDVRLALEPYLTRLAAERATAAELASIGHVLERFEQALDADPSVAGQLDADFHVTIYEASRSQLMSVLRGYWSRLQLELSRRVYATEVPRRFLREHVAILDALRSGDGELAAERMRKHIEHGRAALQRGFADDDAAPPAASQPKPRGTRRPRRQAA
jgi:DNA-binding GntR family transcriptional regulator